MTCPRNIRCHSDQDEEIQRIYSGMESAGGAGKRLRVSTQ